jgi:hypothetical protein
MFSVEDRNRVRGRVLRLQRSLGATRSSFHRYLRAILRLLIQRRRVLGVGPSFQTVPDERAGVADYPPEARGKVSRGDDRVCISELRK